MAQDECGSFDAWPHQPASQPAGWHVEACAPAHPPTLLASIPWLRQVDEVKNIMVDNIEKVLERGEKIELLVDKTDNLRFQVGPSPAPCH